MFEFNFFVWVRRQNIQGVLQTLFRDHTARQTNYKAGKVKNNDNFCQNGKGAHFDTLKKCFLEHAN